MRQKIVPSLAKTKPLDVLNIGRLCYFKIDFMRAAAHF